MNDSFAPRPTILIVDADALTLTGVAAALHLSGYEAHCARDTEAAARTLIFEEVETTPQALLESLGEPAERVQMGQGELWRYALGNDVLLEDGRVREIRQD